MSGSSRCAIFVCLLLTAEAAQADQGLYYGMLRARDLSPFAFLRLDMRPAHALSIEPKTFAFEAELGYQNTWALSRNVRRYLTDLESQGRRDLGPAEVDAIRNLPGENYLLDAEQALLDFTIHYKLSSHWTAYAIASAVSYHGGFLDGAIESFHEKVGFSTFGRHATRRNDTNLIFDLESGELVMLDAPAEKGFTDPIFGLRYIGLTLPGAWQMSVEVAAKTPLQGKRQLLSTGRADYGAQVSLRRLGRRHGLYVDFAGVYYAGDGGIGPSDSSVIPTLVLGWEYRCTERTNLNLQGYVSTSPYSRQQTELAELLGEKYQMSLGIRHRFEHMLISFAVTENLQNFNNTPDVGFQFGLAWAPGARNRPSAQ